MLTLHVNTPIVDKATTIPLYVVVDNWLYHVSRFSNTPSTPQGHTRIGGIDFFLERFQRIEYLQEQFEATATTAFHAYREEYTKQAHGALWQRVMNNQKLGADLQYSVKEFLPAGGRVVPKTPIKTMKTSTEVLPPAINTLLPSAYGVVNGCVYALSKRQHGELCIENTTYAWGQKLLTIGALSEQYNLCLQSWLRAGVDEAIQQLPPDQFLGEDYLTLKKSGSLFECGDFGYDTQHHLLFEYLPPFTHSESGQAFGYREIAIGAPIENNRLAVTQKTRLRKDTGCSMSIWPVEPCICDGRTLDALRNEQNSSRLTPGTPYWDYAYLNHLCQGIAGKNARYFHEYEVV